MILKKNFSENDSLLLAILHETSWSLKIIDTDVECT